ncbi:putative F-box domain-containing protein [Helianthus annuus]|uniref:F-box domain-containing protein n=1 Tax=Helianthus annuus TaxID=4232 RepID=A0A9K3DEN3_HELAN|nr:putative F-box domain-containing protein [Helianthus annuus]KAJ0630999.1 putative F-box domain, leucine-rich repeat domain superfamily, F-box-like domain superfamily [Helianthus annuus]KAJ0634872.1 putative F-box domain, leucine-rich repeat domain superfamily, F-box-like domain superfamily [Helianthus annuus]
MDSSNGKKNVEEDRLSSLPDDLIYKILAFIGIEYVVQTSVLSSRWRFIWTSMPYLNFSREKIYHPHKFSKFITHFFSSRNNQTKVSSVKLSFHGEDNQDVDVFVQQIMEYAFSHNIQQLNVACLFDKYGVEFPHFLSSSQSLKHLSVTKEHVSATPYLRTYVVKAPSTWEFPALTTLYLHDVHLCCDETTDKCIDLFSKCPNLKSLTIKSCYMGVKVLSICLPLLSNLTLESIRGGVKVFNIVSPQLKNLTMKSDSQYYPRYARDRQYRISAPDLVFLLYRGYDHLQLYTNGFLSLEKADICVSSPKDAHEVLHLLPQLHNVKSLTLNLEIVEKLGSLFFVCTHFTLKIFVQQLSSSVELMSHPPSPFANLRSLKIYPTSEHSRVEKHKSGKMSAELKRYLLDASPSAIVTMISREDVRTMKNTRLAQNLTTRLMALLQRVRSDIETIMAKIYEQRKAQVDKVIVADWNVHWCWQILSERIEKREEKPSGVISKLNEILKLLRTLPASNRATIQPSISTLWAEADIVMNLMTDLMKMYFDEKRRHLSVCCHELATTL